MMPFTTSHKAFVKMTFPDGETIEFETSRLDLKVETDIAPITSFSGKIYPLDTRQTLEFDMPMHLTAHGKKAILGAIFGEPVELTPEEQAAEAAKSMREMFLSWIAAGFTEDQALKLLANILAQKANSIVAEEDAETMKVRLLSTDDVVPFDPTYVPSSYSAGKYVWAGNPPKDSQP
jgi:hypothetical protein